LLFSIEPKAERYDLFNREQEIKKLSESVETDKIIILFGLRRIGKTSLIKTYLNTTENYSIFMDCRGFISEGRIDKQRFEMDLFSALKEEMKRDKLLGLLKNISSVSIKGIELKISADETTPSIANILKEIDTVLEKKKKRLIIAFDEAQLLKYYGRDGSDLLYLMAYAYDNLKHIVFILTGSEIGLLFDFLKLEDPDMPLYGRYITEMSLKRFEPSKSKDFLKKGMKELGHDMTERDVERVVTRLDGIVGYLSRVCQEVCVKSEKLS